MGDRRCFITLHITVVSGKSLGGLCFSFFLGFVFVSSLALWLLWLLCVWLLWLYHALPISLSNLT